MSDQQDGRMLRAGTTATEQDVARAMRAITRRAKEIDPETYVSYFTYGSILDPYGFGYEGEDNTGRIWWVANPDGEGAHVTAWDFMEAHPDVTWDEIWTREEQWSRNTDPFHGLFC